MSSFSDFQKQIHACTVASKHTEALAYFKEHKQLFLKSEIASNVYLVADMLTCLRKTGAFEAAGRFMEIYGMMPGEQLPERIVTAYALVWYDCFKNLSTDSANRNENNNDNPGSDSIPNNHFIWNKLEQVLPILAKFQSDISKNIYNLIASRVLRYETSKTNPQATHLKRICEMLDAANLKTDCFEFEREKKGEVKKIELASLREEWYSHYSKSLFQLGEYDKCIVICNEALTQISKLHYSNEVWFSRRIAQSMSKTGRIDEAIECYGQLLKRKKDWFMYAGLAMLYNQSGKADKAIRLMHTAITSSGEFNFKVEIFEQLGDIYASKGEVNLSVNHYQLAYCIRASEGWKIGHTLRQKAALNLEAEEAGILLRKLKAELNAIWNPLSEATRNKIIPKDKLCGTIIRVGIPKETGKDIWIKADSGEQFYAFVKRESSNYQQLITGVKVQFGVLPSQDGRLRKAVAISINHIK